MVFLTKFFNLIFITKEALLKDNTHLHANLDIEKYHNATSLDEEI